jgi:flagellar hook-associated protein 2
MSSIQSSIGLITGIPIIDTVDQLMQLASQPRDLLISRNQAVQAEQLAINTLSTRLVGFQFDVGKLKSESLYDASKAGSSDSSLLTASVDSESNPAAGSYQFTPLRMASSQQLVSGRFESDSDTVSAGSFTIRSGGFVNQGISLEELNGGQGIVRGEISITDKSGATAAVDLSFALTTDDVIEAINTNTTINVTAEGIGDAFRLTDNTGQGGTLSVQEIGGGTTAASLGLAGLSTSGSSVTGSDLLQLDSGTRLSLLNDSTGIQIRDDLDDLEIALADGTSVLVNLDDATRLGNVIDKISAASPTKLTAAISADGDHLELTDQTSGASTFQVTNVAGGTAAQDLGLTGTASGGVITSDRLVAGLKSSLVSSLKGGQGASGLGSIQITDRAGATDAVDLSSAETVDDIVALVNTAATGIVARINDAQNGILLEDTTGASASNLIIASNDANNSAELLGIVVDAGINSVNSGSLGRQTISEATKLTALNSGKGIDLGDFILIDSDGQTGAVDLDSSGTEAETIGDVIDQINAAGVGVEARINDTGDGILIIDTAGGTGTLEIKEVGSGTTAADLNILGQAVEVSLNGTPTDVIDGSETSTITIASADTLADVVESINAASAGVTASIIHDGQGVRLAVTSDKGGSASQLLLDLDNSDLAFQEISKARDAVLLYGDLQTGNSGILLSSSTNQFDQVVDGLNLQIEGTSATAVTVTVESNDQPLIDSIKDLVSSYNSFRTELDSYTDFDEVEMTTGILFGTGEALRVDTVLSRALTDRYFGLGDIQSLEQIGLSVDDNGKLELDQDKLQQAFADDSEALKQFFVTEEIGLAAKFDRVIDTLVDADNSMLTNRNTALQSTIDINNERVESMNESLERQRELLLLQFYQLETVISKLQQGLSALESLTPIPPLTSTSS